MGLFSIFGKKKVVGKRNVARSPHWPHAEKFVKEMRKDRCDFLRDDQPIDGPIQVHHWHPFEDCKDAGRPELELCLENLFAACETEKDKPADNHHNIACHLEDFKSFNADLRACVPLWKGLKCAEIKARPDFQKMLASKPVEYHAMSADQQKAFRADLDKNMPTDKITVWDGKNWTRNGKALTPEQAVVPDPFFTKN